MKKIAFLLDGYGNRRHYLQFKALKEVGFEPCIITFKEAKEGYLLSKRLDQKFFYVLPFSRKKVKKHFSLRCALSLLNLLKKEKILVVLTHHYKFLRYLWFCKIFYQNLKIIFHIVSGESIKGWHQKCFFRIFKRLIDKILVNSSALKEELIKKRLAHQEEIEIFYSGVELEEFEINFTRTQAREKFGLPLEDFIFGMVAQFRKEKDHKGLITAFQKLKAKGYSCKLALAGDGPEFEKCKKLVNTLGLQNEIIFLGKLDPSEVPYFLKALNVFVYPTYREGMPLAVLEAMATKLPIITTDAEGLPDLFETSKPFGYLLPKGDIIALAEYMEKMINLSEDERKFLGENAQKRIEEAFSAKILKENTIKLFKELLSF